MKTLLARALGSLALCLGFYFLTRHLLGPVVWVLLALLIGISFSRVLIDASAEFAGFVHSALRRSQQGVHYQFHGIAVHVVEDADHCRWLPTDDIRKLIPALPLDATLERIYPSGWQWQGKPPIGLLRDDALLHYLREAQSAKAIQFKTWVDRTVAHPARTARKRRGIYLRDPILPLGDE